MSEFSLPQETGKALERGKLSTSSPSTVFPANSSGWHYGSSRSRIVPKEKDTVRKFACPYHKRYPGQHLPSTSCVSPGFPNIFRVKEHLYRKHKASNTRCSRCQEIFGSEEALEHHQRARDVCAIQQAPEPSGFTKEQEKQLRSRKGSKRRTEEQKWMDVYRILFPQDNNEPNPYVDGQQPSDFHRFKEYSRGVFPEVLSRKLASSECSLDLVMECQEEVFQLFQEDNDADFEAPTPDSTTVAESGARSKPPFYHSADNNFMPMGLDQQTKVPGIETAYPTWISNGGMNPTSMNNTGWNNAGWNNPAVVQPSSFTGGANFDFMGNYPPLGELGLSSDFYDFSNGANIDSGCNHYDQRPQQAEPHTKPTGKEHLSTRHTEDWNPSQSKPPHANKLLRERK
ncbi:zinc finger c2h2-type protein [Diplodia corticola]|uniref:Zinc finger c2h2-type protein n=1 Tax=Diplodia corticola TaxID=236234 RepID=A0A1J9RUZ2_9PEZI|nr:zinc finger c2h2-type protein [Diplodia corticola]OJD31317.1 zinc finger c2h2-type protein [Diplodia corticola]